MIERKVMTIGELLAWAYEETQLADSLERIAATMPDDIRALIMQQVKNRRERSRWLDHQVEHALDMRDGMAGPEAGQK